MEELIHLLRARETRFVENAEAFLSVVRLFAPRQMPLQCARFDSRFSELLRCARCRREAFHLIALSLGDFADRN